MPNGVIREAARSLLTRLTSRAGEPRVPFDEEVQGYLRCFRGYSERGITSAGIAGGNPATSAFTRPARATMVFRPRARRKASIKPLGHA
jgi:hypothetical protein